MKYALLLLALSCTQATPKKDTDIPFCKEDSECTIYRSRCGKIKALNIKYFDYVENEFKKREEKVHCENFPDQRRYRTTCELNACTLIEAE